MSVSAMKLEWRSWLPFALLCVIAGSRWMFVDSMPQMSSTLRTETAGCMLAALIAGIVALTRRDAKPAFRQCVKLTAIGACLLAVPALGAALRGPGGNSFSRAMALCFVPAIVLVWNGVRADPDARMTIWPGLTGIAAGLLLFPLVLPEGWVGYAQLLAPSLLIGAAIAFARTQEWRRWGSVFFFAGGALCLAFFEWLRTFSSGGRIYTVHWQGVLIDLAVAWLVMLSARSLDSLRYASRYFFVPLLTILEGVIFLREWSEGRFWLGLILMFCAAVSLWWQGPPESGGLHLT